MATPKSTAPAVPDAPIATPPAADAGAGTSADADLLEQLTGDGTGEALPPMAAEPQEAVAATSPLGMPGFGSVAVTPTPAFPYVGTADFAIEFATEAELDEHLRILEKKERIRKLTAGDAAQPAPGASATAETITLPGVATVTVTPTPVATPPHGPRLITKVDEHGNEQALPQAAWDALGATNLAKFTDVPTQPVKPASLI